MSFKYNLYIYMFEYTTLVKINNVGNVSVIVVKLHAFVASYLC